MRGQHMKITNSTSRACVLTTRACVLGIVSTAFLMGGCAGYDAPKWGYVGGEGKEPAQWGEIGPDCVACAEGLEQSPIDIPAGAPRRAEIVFSYAPSALNIVNNGHAIKVDYDAGSFIEVEGERYNLLQFHFHALSEHTVAGEHADMEVHFVHQSEAGVYAVVGVFMNRGAFNGAYEAVRVASPGAGAQARAAGGVTVNAMEMLPGDRSYHRYDGSFTTPPCTEGVKWFVMQTPVTLSSSQISTFTSLYDNNYRPVQPMNSRSFR